MFQDRFAHFKQILFFSFTVSGLLSLGSCGGGSSDPMNPSSIRFAARVMGEEARCGQAYEGVGAGGTTIRIQDLRFYLSQLILLTAEGNEVPVELVEDGKWQHGGVALLDFEDATGACSELGTADTNSVVNFTAPTGNYTGLRFSVGVPFESNHQDATTAPAPLNLGAMQWNWQAGYKFIRIDLLNENTAPDNRWFLHLGSTGCESDSRITVPTTTCARPNTVEVELDNFNPSENTVVLDIGMFLQGIDLSQNTPETLPGCMSTPTDPECPQVFQRLGLDIASGQPISPCEGCQSLFSVE
ncbi:metallo-mystery pair system four-Cys motif protein [bacterium]|nr:metallo-mystery pair system four-Cys motif protein [bacterium]